MSSKTYHFLSRSPSAVMLAEVLKKNDWSFSPNATLNDSLFDIPEDISCALEYKHVLADFLKKHDLNFAPLTYYIDDVNYNDVIRNLPEGKWILKPSMLNNGQDIHLFHQVSELLRHYQSNQRMGGPQVLQAYIDPPHLLQGPQLGHKYSLRMFVVMTFPYQAFLYPTGYFNICLSPYDTHRTNSLEGHLSNEHLIAGRRNVIQIPSFQYPIFQSFFPKIQKMLSVFFQHFSQQVKSDIYQKIAFLGIDFMLDANENLFLLEMNHGPCFPAAKDHPLQEKLYQPFWQACHDEILPIILHSSTKPLKKFQELSGCVYT